MHLHVICITLLILILRPSWTANILNRPEVIEGGGSRTVQEGGTKTLGCVFRGSPQPTVIWKKDGLIIRSAQTEYNSFFRITDASASDSGAYICEGVNSEGTGSATYFLTVVLIERITPTTPAFISTTTRTNGGGANIKGTSETEPTPTSSIIETKLTVNEPEYYAGNPKLVVYVQRERTLELYCSVITSAAQFSINWFRGSTRVQVGGDTYRKWNFDISDEGRYTCIASNSAVSDSSSVEVRVGSPLRITRSPSSRYYTLREALSLRVELSRQNNFEVNWYRVNGNSLIRMQQGNGVYFQSNKKRMDINPLIVKYIGAYTVRVESQGESDSANFSINAYLVITTKQPRETTPFVEGSTINLPCAYYGYPPPEVDWYLNNQELIPSTSNRYNLSSDNILRVGPLGANDNGNRIECRVRQNELRRRVEFTLEMGLPPEIVTTNCDVSLCVNSNVKLVCKANSEASLEYSWYRSTDISSSITPSSKYNVYSNGKLDIVNPNSNDIGTYICEARNKYGRDYIRCRVKSTAGLDLISSEQSIILTLGREINIYCRVNGSLGATVSWYKDDDRALPSDAEVSTRTSGQILLSILSFQSVTTQHDGEYTCSVSNCANEVKQTHLLMVRQNVEITRTPDRTDFCSGSTAKFPCEATGFPEPEINWYFNGEIIISGEGGFQISGRNTLSVIGGPVSKTGYYTCNASNPFSWRTYRFGAFFKDTPLPTFEDTTLQLPVLNQDFCLSCFPQISGVEYTYRWYKRNSVLTNSAKYEQSNEWQLCISNFNSQDLGLYSCRVTNCVGTSRKFFNINSYQGQDVAPSISTTRTEYTVTQGRTVRLFCRATGSPEPSISWYYENQLVSEDTHFSLDELPNLKIDNVQRSLHNGAYECRATNGVGADTLSIEMTVYQTPKLVPIRSQRVEVGLTACFDCSLTQGYPAPTATWTKDSAEVVSQGRVNIKQNNTLCISGVRGDDQGAYRCTARNTLGWAYVQGTLQVRTCGQLRFTSIQLNHTVVDGDSLTVGCPIQPNVFECSMIVTWNELTFGTNGVLKRIPSSDPRLVGDRLTIQLHMNGTGLYQCVAYNDYSIIAQRHSVRVVAPPWEVPFVSQQIFRVNSEVSLNCPIRGVPPLSYIWLLEGTELVSGETLVINNDQITIYSASASNTGQYSCTGSNPYGHKEAKFEVTICGPITLELTEDHEVEEKSRTTFDCYLQGEITADSIEFLVGEDRKTVAQLPSKRYTYNKLEKNRAELRISTRVEDTGPITCRVSTTCGTSEITHLLTVRPKKADGLRVAKNQITHPGTVPPNCHNQFTLKCPVRGKPKPTYTWYHNNTKIVFKNNAHVISAKGKKEITVHDPDINDAGNYRCNATNNQGRVSYTYIIPIQLPRASSIYQKHVAFEGQDLNLACKPDILANRKWSKNLRRVSHPNSAESNDWVINGVQSSDEGVYLCCAKSGDDMFRYIHEVQVQD